MFGSFSLSYLRKYLIFLLLRFVPFTLLVHQICNKIMLQNMNFKFRNVDFSQVKGYRY